MSVSLYIAIILAIAIIACMIVQQILNERAIKKLDQNEFRSGIRKAQVIDIREKVDYDYGHTNGSRNILMTILRQRFRGPGRDQPVYLRDTNRIANYGAARILKKNGYTDIYMLRSGCRRWTGKTRSKKQLRKFNIRFNRI